MVLGLSILILLSVVTGRGLHALARRSGWWEKGIKKLGDSLADKISSKKSLEFSDGLHIYMKDYQNNGA